MPESTANKKVAVVTGANRGIGLQIVKNLTQELDSTFDVLLTSRNEQRGQDAVKQVADAGTNTKAHVKFHQLDIDDHKSIENLRNDLQKTYGGLDILVQNGAILLRESQAPIGEVAETTIKTNYWSVRDLCRTLLPIMRENGRIVLLASRLGVIFLCKDAETRKRLTSSDLKMEELDKIMQTYVDEAKARSNSGQQRNESKMWEEDAFKQPYGAYGISKLGVVAMARVLQREADAPGGGGGKNIVVTSCCPGYVDTDMSAHEGEKTVEEGADTPTHLAVIKEGGESGRMKGQFLGEREVIDWENYKGRQW